MAKPASSPQLRSRKALEMVMRDVRDGLEQAACLAACNPGFDDLEILSIEADAAPSPSRAPIYHLPQPRSSDVLNFLLTRESRRYA